MPSERTLLRLRDIVDDAVRIEAFVDGLNLAGFLADERTIFAVERLLQRITEAAVQIDVSDVPQLGPAFPVPQMRALGNRLRHEYRDVDRGVIFDIACNEVPALRAAAERALQS
jgi:uncharacterized protein with HEPN domain